MRGHEGDAEDREGCRLDSTFSPHRIRPGEHTRFQLPGLTYVFHGFLAEDWETARVAASLVRVEYQKESHITDLHVQRDKAFAIDAPEKPEVIVNTADGTAEEAARRVLETLRERGITA